MSVIVKVQKLSGKPENKKYGKKNKDEANIELEKALKKFKRKIKDSKILKIYHEKMYFVKSSEQKRTKKSIAKYRAYQQTLLNKS